MIIHSTNYMIKSLPKLYIGETLFFFQLWCSLVKQCVFEITKWQNLMDEANNFIFSVSLLFQLQRTIFRRMLNYLRKFNFSWHGNRSLFIHQLCFFMNSSKHCKTPF